MRNNTKLVLAFFASAIFSTQVIAAEKPFVTVNGVGISQATADMFMQQGKANGMPDAPEMKAKVREELIRRKKSHEISCETAATLDA